MEIKMPNKKQDLYVVELTQQGSHMGCSSKEEFYRARWCCQCHQAEETIVHLMLECPYSKEVWKEVERLIGIGNLWEGGSLEEAFKTWCNRKETSKIRALPLNIVWGVWLARNLKLFEDKETLPLKCVVQSLNILNAYP
jgi:hypothetical protein